jgi:hypothetical protein
MHPLDNSVDSGAGHYKGIVLEDTVNIEVLRFVKAEWSFNQKRIFPAKKTLFDYSNVQVLKS